MNQKSDGNSGNHKIRFSCVMDRQPRFAQQALGWAATLLTFGGQRPESLVVHAINGCHPSVRRIFDSWGVATRAVAPFAAWSRNSNKLTQLESDALADADYVVVCDCDLVFCEKISRWVSGDSIRARTPSYGGLTPKQWSRLFQTAELDMPPPTITAVLDGQATLPTYCNTALCIIPQSIFQRLRPVWPKWTRWLSERPHLTRPFAAHVQKVAFDQVALALSCAELGLPIDRLPVEVNFPVRRAPVGRLYSANPDREYHPLVMHHHGRTRRGLLRLTQMFSLNRQIVRVNRLLASVHETSGASIRLMMVRKSQGQSGSQAHPKLLAQPCRKSQLPARRRQRSQIGAGRKTR